MRHFLRFLKKCFIYYLLCKLPFLRARAQVLVLIDLLVFWNTVSGNAPMPSGAQQNLCVRLENRVFRSRILLLFAAILPAYVLPRFRLKLPSLNAAHRRRIWCSKCFRVCMSLETTCKDNSCDPLRGLSLTVFVICSDDRGHTMPKSS